MLKYLKFDMELYHLKITTLRLSYKDLKYNQTVVLACERGIFHLLNSA